MEQLFALLETTSLRGVLAGAFINDDDDPKQARLLLEAIYLKFDNQWLRCSSIGQYDQLALELSEKIEPAASTIESRVLEDYEFCVVPLTNLFMNEALASYRVQAVQCFLDSRADEQRAIVTTIALLLENNQTLFLDPRNTFGVRLGNAFDLEEWMRLNAESDSSYRQISWKRRG